MTITSIGICDICCPPLVSSNFHNSTGGFLTGAISQLFVAADIRDAAIVASHDYFGAACERFAVFTARAACLPGPITRKDHLAGAAFADAAADTSQHADHVVVGWVERPIVSQQKPDDEPEDDRGADQSAQNRAQNDYGREQSRMARQQISGAAEPCEERRYRSEIDNRHFRSASNSRMAAAHVRNMDMPVRHIEMQVRNVHVEVHVRHMQAAAQESEQAQRDSNQETCEIKRFPVHDLAPAARLFAPSRCADEVAPGFNTSLNRSTNSGASRIAPSNNRHLRVS